MQGHKGRRTRVVLNDGAYGVRENLPLVSKGMGGLSIDKSVWGSLNRNSKNKRWAAFVAVSCRE